MFFRKLLGNNDAKAEKPSGPPAGMQTMGANLQRRFAKGIQYNSESCFFCDFILCLLGMAPVTVYI